MERCFFFFFYVASHNAKNFWSRKMELELEICRRLVLQTTVTQAFPCLHFGEHCTKNKQFCCFFLNDIPRFLTCEPTYECLVEIWSFLLSFTSKGTFSYPIFPASSSHPLTPTPLTSLSLAPPAHSHHLTARIFSDPTAGHSPFWNVLFLSTLWPSCWLSCLLDIPGFFLQPSTFLIPHDLWKPAISSSFNSH